MIHDESDDATMTAPSQLCQTATGDVSPGNPCHLSAASAASGLGDWEYLANFIPPADVVAAMMRRFRSVEPARASQILTPRAGCYE